MTLQQWLETNDDTDKAGGHISEQWTGIDSYGDSIDINAVAKCSGKKMLWICSQGHQWFATIAHRTSCLSGCPMCSRNGASKRGYKSKLKIGVNDLQTWCNSNKPFGSRLIREFVGIDEHNNPISMTDVTYGSQQKVFWKCSEGHQWCAAVYSRTSSMSGCPYCSGSIASDKNSLYNWCINNNRNDLIEQFVGKYDDGTAVDIHNISSGSSKKVMWEHVTSSGEKHVWAAAVKHRTLNNSRCPYCFGSKRVLKGFNDLGTWCKNNAEFGQTLENEFTGICTDGNTYSIDTIPPFSYKKLLWRHTTKSNDVHEWYASLYNRTSHKTLCPICNNKGTSLPEQIIYMCIKQVYKDTISRGKFQGYEFDISIPELKTCIEYGSTYYHDERQERDDEKQKLCEKYNVNFIKIIEDSNRELDEVWGSNLIVTRIEFNRIRSIEKIIKHLCKILKINYSDINFKAAVNDAIDIMNN